MTDDTAERSWQAWYEPEHDISRYMTTSPYDKMRAAFLAAWGASAAAERERLVLAVRHTCACQSCKDAIADLLTGEGP